MAYSVKRTESELESIFEHLLKKDENWVKALWELTDYLVNIQFSKRNLAVSREKAWDATTEIFGQLKQRIDCIERVRKDGTKIKPPPIENIVAYTYFALPKRFSRWCSTTMTREERDKELVRTDIYNPSTKGFSVNIKVEQQLAVTRPEPSISREETEKLIIEWLGKAQNNVEYKKRRQKLKMQGWEIVEGKLVQIELTEKELARELAILESKKEVLQKRERIRLKRIKFIRSKLYGKT